MNTMLYIWVIIAFLGLIFEMGSPGLFYFLSFSFGALFSAIVAFFSSSITVQGIAFLIGTTCSLVILKYWLNAQFYFEGRKDYKSNVYALKGKRGYVVDKIAKDRMGQVKLNGQIWLAESEDGQPIESKEAVKVVKVEGCRLIVVSEKSKQ